MESAHEFEVHPIRENNSGQWFQKVSKKNQVPRGIFHAYTTREHCIALRCFVTVFQRQYRYFSVALNIVFSLTDRYQIFTNNWLWIEICENIVLSKIDHFTMTTMKKNFEIDKSLISCDLDQLLKIQH